MRVWVWGLGFMVQGARLQGSWFRIQGSGSGLRVHGLGFRVKVAGLMGSWVQGSWVQDSGFRAQGSGCRDVGL